MFVRILTQCYCVLSSVPNLQLAKWKKILGPNWVFTNFGIQNRQSGFTSAWKIACWSTPKWRATLPKAPSVSYLCMLCSTYKNVPLPKHCVSCLNYSYLYLSPRETIKNYVTFLQASSSVDAQILFLSDAQKWVCSSGTNSKGINHTYVQCDHDAASCYIISYRNI